MSGRRGWRLALWSAAAVVVVLGLGYVAAYALSGERLPRHTTVEGVPLGGLTPEAAEARLRERLAARVQQPLVLEALGERTSVDAVTAGLEVDVAASVEQAGAGRSWDPRVIWDRLTGGDDLEAVVDADEELLDAALQEFDGVVARPAREGDVVFGGARPRAREPRAGKGIDLEAARAVVVEAFPSAAGGSVVLPTLEVQPEIDDLDVQRAMRFARRAVSAPVVYAIGGEDVVLPPARFVPALSLEPADGRLRPVVDEERLLRIVRPAMRTVAAAPQDATVALVDGRPQVVPAKKGVTFDEEEVTGRFLRLLRATGDDRRTRLRTVVAEPDFTTAEARALRIVEAVSEFTTYFPHADYRNINIGRAAELVDGTVLEPGETFSLNETVGERTAENGFTKGFIISDGVFREDYGGGVSQVATTLFNAAFFAGLEDVEHKPHSFYIDRYPVGREATVAWPTVDLRFANDTPYGVLIEAWRVPSTPSSQGSMNVRMWSTKYWQIESETSARYNFTEPSVRRMSGEDCVPNEGYGGFDVDVYRLFYRPGSDELVRRERMHTTYTPSDTVICS